MPARRSPTTTSESCSRSTATVPIRCSTSTFSIQHCSGARRCRDFVRASTQEEGLPRVRSLALNDLGPLPRRPEVIEGNYRFQARLDYIDEDQNAVSTYQTLYGFFWLNSTEGYVIIHARNPGVLKALKHAIEEATDIHLTSLVISKQLKNALPFLLRESFRSGRLHDPDPGPDRFRWLTIADDDPYAVPNSFGLGISRGKSVTLRCAAPGTARWLTRARRPH